MTAGRAPRTSRSPLREKPLRLPGQSLMEERSRLIDDKFEPWLILALFFVMLAAWEWLYYLRPRSPMPWLVSAIAGLTVLLAFWRLVRLRRQLKSLRLGIEGERVVGQYLDRLASRGYRVFHDVVADGFNLDHVLVGPAGVFTVETKTHSKPAGDSRVSYDGSQLVVGGRLLDRDPLSQARSQARWLARLIADTTDRRVFVQPVVVFPGWYVEAAPGAQRDVWVLEPKGLPAFVESISPRLSKEDIALMAKAISMHVRGRQAERDGKDPFV
jgi:hypothetical protein